MQFLAAKSLCTNLLAAKYSIPQATSRHIRSRVMRVIPYTEQAKWLLSFRMGHHAWGNVEIVVLWPKSCLELRNFLRSPLAMNGRMTRGSPAVSSKATPIRPSTFGWLNSFIVTHSAMKSWMSLPAVIETSPNHFRHKAICPCGLHFKVLMATMVSSDSKWQTPLWTVPKHPEEW